MAASSASGSGSRSLFNILHSAPSVSSSSASSSFRAVSTQWPCHCPRRYSARQSSSLHPHARRTALSARCISTSSTARNSQDDELSAAISEETQNVKDQRRTSARDRDSESSNRSGEESWLDNFLSTDLFSGARSDRKSTKPETITLEEFRKFQPSPKSIKIHSNFLPHVRERLKSQRMWQMTYNNVYNGYNVQQLLSLAQQAGISIKPKKKSGNKKNATQPKKAELVSMMIKHVFKLSNPNDKPGPPEASFKKSFLISRTALFLLLAGSGRLIAQLALRFGIDLRPEQKSKQQDDDSSQANPGPPLFYLAASGDKEVIENQFSDALQSFIQSIRSDTFALDISVEELEPEAVQQISQQTICSITLDQPIVLSSPTSTANRSLRLSATNDFDIRRAKTLLSSMQARHLQPTPHNLSYAAPSPLDEDYVENPDDDLALYGFLPALPNSSILPTLKAMFGERSSSLFRLARVRRAAWSRGGQQTDMGKMSLVDNQDSQKPLGTSRNWERVDEILRLSDWHFDDKIRALSPSPSSTSISHSLQLGHLLYPSRSPADELAAGPESQILQQVFGAPLNGSWTLDTAYEWFRSQQDNPSTQPVWTPCLLPGSAIDSAASHGAHLDLWMKGDEAQEAETIRLTYWVHPSSKQGDQIDREQVVRLEIDIAEIEESIARDDASETREKAVDTRRSADEGGLDDLLGGAPDSGHQAADTSVRRRSFRYEIASARWIKAKQANVYAPDHGVDLRFENEVDLPVDVSVLPVQEYLDALTASVSSPPSLTASSGERPRFYSVQRREYDGLANRPSLNQRYTTQAISSDSSSDVAHPRLSNEPVPTLSASHQDAFPPLKLNLKGLECNFESVKRVYTSRWELRLSDKEPDAKVCLVNESSLDGSGSGGGNLTQSRTSIQWQYEEEKRGAKSNWRERMESVKGLLRPVVIGT
ncbi:unnamed protein product [Sympodiomycopsis kandeliae]